MTMAMRRDILGAETVTSVGNLLLYLHNNLKTDGRRSEETGHSREEGKSNPWSLGSPDSTQGTLRSLPAGLRVPDSSPGCRAKYQHDSQTSLVAH